MTPTGVVREPIVAVAPLTIFVPLMTTEVPPAVGPWFGGVMLVTWGFMAKAQQAGTTAAGSMRPRGKPTPVSIYTSSLGISFVILDVLAPTGTRGLHVRRLGVI